MRIETFCWLMLAALLVGNGLIVWKSTNQMAPAFLNLGALIVLLVSAFLFKNEKLSPVTTDVDPADSGISGSPEVDPERDIYPDS